MDFNIIEYSNEEKLAEDVTGEKLGGKHILEHLEEHNKDSQFFLDVSLESIVETFEYNGVGLSKLEELNKALYGAFVEVYKVPGAYILEYGTR